MDALKSGSDVLFILLGGIMVLAMHAGFAFLEVGTVRKKNQVNALVKILTDFSVSTIAYFLVFPVVFGFIVGVAPEGVAVMTDIGKYLDFVMTLFLAFGITFEVPVAVVLLVKMGMVSVAKLREIRPYVIVGAFVLGAIFTPPDIISQFMLAIPMWLLYELGILVSIVITRPKPEEEPVYQPMSEDEMDAELDRIEQESREQK